MAFWNRIFSNSSRTSHTHSASCGHDHDHDHAHHAKTAAPTSARLNPTSQAPRTSAGPAALAQVKNVIAVASGKGGVGKSTVSTNLAIALRHLGATVGMLDADVYGPSQPSMLGATEMGGRTTADGKLLPVEMHGVKLISMGLLMGDDRPLVWRAPMAMQAINQFLANVEWGALDYLIIDLPPGTGDVQLTMAQQASLAGAVIVTTPQEVALGIAKKGLEMFRQLNIPILGVVENMSGFTCGHCGQVTPIFKEGGGSLLASDLDVPFLGAIPLDPQIMQSGEDGIPLIERGTGSTGAQVFLQIAARFDQEVRKVNARGAVTEEPKSFGLTPDGNIMIQWANQPTLVLDAYRLRLNCGCANCIDENTGKRILDPAKVPQNLTVRNVQAVGRYALTFAFSDGHSTGIYPFKKLKQLEEVPAGATSAKAPAFASTQAAISPDLIRKILDEQVNPGVAAHGGKIEFVELRGTAVVLKMSGGCQGCSSAQATLKQGVERALFSQIPGITEIVDVTDHSSGKNPFFK